MAASVEDLNEALQRLIGFVIPPNTSVGVALNELKVTVDFTWHKGKLHIFLGTGSRILERSETVDFKGNVNFSVTLRDGDQEYTRMTSGDPTDDSQPTVIVFANLNSNNDIILTGIEVKQEKVIPVQPE